MNENIRELNYEQGLKDYGKKHKLTARELFEQVKTMPQVTTTQMFQTMGNLGKMQTEPYMSRKFDLKSKNNRLLKLNEKTNRKLNELDCHNLAADEVVKDDPTANSHKTGLPQITKFYQKFKDLNKLVQDD